jgi:predicted kinase
MSELVVVCGVPGVGKTTVAETVTDRVDGHLLRTDVVRKELYPDPDYTDEETRRTYATVFDRARTSIEAGRPAVLDGTFTQRGFRDDAIEVAEGLDVPWTFVRVTCDTAVVEHRIRRRDDDESDADFEIHEMFKDAFDPLTVEHVTVDNSGTLDETRDQVAAHF